MTKIISIYSAGIILYLIAVVLMPVPGKETPDIIYSIAASV